MLFGKYYFYKDGSLIQEIDINDLPPMDEKTLKKYGLNLGADKAVARGVYFEHQMVESEEVLYDEQNAEPKSC